MQRLFIGFGTIMSGKFVEYYLTSLLCSRLGAPKLISIPGFKPEALSNSAPHFRDLN